MIGTGETVAEPEPVEARTKAPILREQLRDFLSRYYANLHYRPVIARDILEIYPLEKKLPQFQYVFDRRALQDNPTAELITFNSPMLMDVINEVTTKGHIAKGFIPFACDPEHDFNRAINDLVTRSGLGNLTVDAATPRFIVNGEIRETGHTLIYAPFLVFIIKITLKCIEPQEFLEKIVVPILDESRLDARYVDSFVEKVKEYVDSPASLLINEMPVPGECLDFTEEQVEAVLQGALFSIQSKVSERKADLETRMAGRLEKELEIVKRYYKQRQQDLKAEIDADSEKAVDTTKSTQYRKQKQADMPKRKEELNQIKKEVNIKQHELEENYAVSAEYALMGAAAIYVPADFHYTCTITTDYGSLEVNLFYDIFTDSVIAPLCESCGQPFSQGFVCSNLHLCCPTCVKWCSECGVHICSICNYYTCQICGAIMCKDHAHPCNRCEKKHKENPWVCSTHAKTCSACERTLCEKCAFECELCGKSLCNQKGKCSYVCQLCKRHMCKDHITECPECGKRTCVDDLRTCPSCHQLYCRKEYSPMHAVCSSCYSLDYHSFYNFLAQENVTFQLPTEVNENPDMSQIKINNTILSKAFMYHPNQWKSVIVPRAFVGIEMHKNRRYIIFRMRRLSGTYILVVDIQAGYQTLYWNPNIFKRLADLVRRQSRPRVYLLQKPAVKWPKMHFSVANQKDDIHE